MSDFIRLSFLTIPGATLTAQLACLIAGGIAPAWYINLSALAGIGAAAALAIYRQRGTR